VPWLISLGSAWDQRPEVKSRLTTITQPEETTTNTDLKALSA
jgi:hypothetical protein